MAKLRGNGDVGTFGNLDNTKREIDEIQKILKNGNIQKVVEFSDLKASIQAFCGLTDKKLNILMVHIGFKRVLLTRKQCRTVSLLLLVPI